MSGISQVTSQAFLSFSSHHSVISKLTGNATANKVKSLGIVLFLVISGAAAAYFAGSSIRHVAQGLGTAGQAILATVGGVGAFVAGSFLGTRVIKVLNGDFSAARRRAKKIMNQWRADVIMTVSTRMKAQDFPAVPAKLGKIETLRHRMELSDDPLKIHSRYLDLRAEVNRQLEDYESKTNEEKRYLDQVALAIVNPPSQQVAVAMLDRLINEYGVEADKRDSYTGDHAFKMIERLTERFAGDIGHGAQKIANKVCHLRLLALAAGGERAFTANGFNSYDQGNSDMGGYRIVLDGKGVVQTYGPGFSPSDRIGAHVVKLYLNLQNVDHIGEATRVKAMETQAEGRFKLNHGSTEVGIWKTLAGVKFENPFQYGRALHAEMVANPDRFPSKHPDIDIGMMCEMMESALEGKDLSELTDVERERLAKAMQVGVTAIGALQMAKEHIQDRNSSPDELMRIACKQTYDRGAMINQSVMVFLKALQTPDNEEMRFSKSEVAMLTQTHFRTVVGDRRKVFGDRYGPGMDLFALVKGNPQAFAEVLRREENFGGMSLTIPGAA